MMKRCPAWWIGIVLVAVCAWVGSAPLGHAQQGTPRMAQQALLPDGASDCSSLGLLFANDIDTGLVRSAANTIGFCAGGALRASLSTSGLTLTTALGVAQGGTGAATFTAGLLRAPGGTTALTSVTSVPDVMTFAPTARTSGSAPFFLITTPADTTLAAAAEAPGILLGGTSAGGTVTRQFSGNDTVALQREIVIPQITYTNSVASKTFTLASSLSLAGVPIKSTNVLGSAAALNIEAGNGSTWTNATGLIVNAPTGATNNYAAQFLGGGVGIGGPPNSAYKLHVISGHLGVGGRIDISSGGSLAVGSGVNLTLRIDSQSLGNFQLGSGITGLNNTSGNASIIRSAETWSPAAGSGSFAFLNLNPTVNASGAQTGTVYGIGVALVPTNLNGATATLLSVGTTTSTLFSGYTELFGVGSTGNVGIGAPTRPTGGGPALAFGQGANPTGIGSNTAGIFAKDVGGTAELFGFDEAGNFPQLTPHPSDFLNTLPIKDRPYPWAYSAENVYLGKKISVDMAGLVAAVEKLTGEKFMYVTDVPQQDWDTNQAVLVAKRNREIEDITAQISALTAKIRSEDDEEKKAELRTQQQSIVIPDQYEPKRMPKWIRQRLVQ